MQLITANYSTEDGLYRERRSVHHSDPLVLTDMSEDELTERLKKLNQQFFPWVTFKAHPMTVAKEGEDINQATIRLKELFSPQLEAKIRREVKEAAEHETQQT